MANGWKFYGAFTNTKQRRVDIFIGFKYVLVNTSTKEINLIAVDKAIKKSLKDTYEQSYFDRHPQFKTSSSYFERGIKVTFEWDANVLHKFHLYIESRIITRRMKIGTTWPLQMNDEHIIEIQTPVRDLGVRFLDSQRPIVSTHEKGRAWDSQIYINANIIDSIINGTNRNTVPHEAGHTLGLAHPDQNNDPHQSMFMAGLTHPLNLMLSADPDLIITLKPPFVFYLNRQKSEYEGIELTVTQRRIILQNLEKFRPKR